MTGRERLTIQRILKVNHAGEYGAIRIYKAQIFVSRIFYPDLVDTLQGFLQHEIEHCRLFKNYMPGRETRPCRTMFLWSWGGFLLGLVTGLMGRNMIMACTSAVENTVHMHLEEQIRFLNGRDDALKDLILEIQKQEVEHLDYAERNMNANVGVKFIKFIVSVATEIVIFLSTWGDNIRMKNDLKFYRKI